MVAETSTLITATQTVLRDIAKHSNALATGLQNAAPPQQSASAGNSIFYLTEVSAQLLDVCRSMDELSSVTSLDK